MRVRRSGAPPGGKADDPSQWPVGPGRRPSGRRCQRGQRSGAGNERAACSASGTIQVSGKRPSRSEPIPAGEGAQHGHAAGASSAGKRGAACTPAADARNAYRYHEEVSHGILRSRRASRLNALRRSCKAGCHRECLRLGPRISMGTVREPSQSRLAGCLHWQLARPAKPFLEDPAPGHGRLRGSPRASLIEGNLAWSFETGTGGQSCCCVRSASAWRRTGVALGNEGVAPLPGDPEDEGELMKTMRAIVIGVLVLSPA